MAIDFQTSYALYKKDLEDLSKKKDYSKLKLLSAKEIVDKIVKGDKDFSNVKIVGIDWARRDLSGFNFSGSKIEWCGFSGCKIKDANFSGAFLDWCLLDSADLSHSDFKNSVVWDSGFIDADLTNVDFTGSDLRYTILANIIGRPNFTKCTEIKIWHSIEDRLKDSDVSSFDAIRDYLKLAGLPVAENLTAKVKLNEMKSSGEKLRFMYDIGRQAFNPEGNLNLYSFKKVGKTSLGEYKSEDAGIYTSKTYDIKNKDNKKTNVYKQ